MAAESGFFWASLPYPAPALFLCPADMYLACYELTQNRDTEEQSGEAGTKGELGSVSAT